ncbi:hypothetical protein RclHR1_09930003 [Rhizophagus clarus]|uniref:DDE-1 domain-containing protein n=1 Tax=Rhizophagus clarus TaxID=94130 RepID=A0A2Z6S638_9GLOM|nr:hypothetical protein RclHR1_09930003 [Rhizophagus clarus]
MTPNQTLATELVSGVKKDKTRITVLLGCNSNRTEKLKPLVIGNVQKPRYFNGINLHNLPADENSIAESSRAAKNKKGKDRADKHQEIQRKKTCQLFDDLSQPLKLTNITLKYLPPKTTFHLQPIDQGVINNFKLDVSQNTISNCWTKAEIMLSINHIQKQIASDQIDLELDAEFEEIEEFLETLPDVAAPFLSDIKYFTKELEELPVEEFLDNKQIIEYVSQDPNEEVLSDSEPELKIIGIKEAAQANERETI